MSFEVEASLLTKILEEGNIRNVLRQRITSAFFSDDSLQDVWVWLSKKYQEFGAVPSLKLLKREFPDFEPYESDDDTQLLVDQLKREHLYADLASAIAEMTDATKEDPEEGFRVMREKVGELTAKHSGTDDEDLTKTIRSVQVEYDKVKNKTGVVGIPWYWSYMTKITQGKEAETLSAIYARPKCLKTFLSLLDADYCHSQFGTVVGYASCEMPLKQLKRRFAALRAKIPYGPFRRGVLTDVEEKKFRRALREIEESPPFFMWKPMDTGEAALTELRAKIEEYQLELLWVDGANYLMEEESHRSFRVITKGLKRLAEVCKIPVCITSQANRDGEKTRGETTKDVAFGDSLAQDADWLFRLVRDQQHKEAREILIAMPALREDEGGAFVINAIPCTDFSQKMIIEPEGDETDEEEEGGML